MAIVSTEPVPPRAHVPSLDWEVEAIILKALEKRKEARYQTAAELAADIDRALAGLPIRARRAGLLYRARKLVARHRGLAGGLAVAALVSLAAGAYAYRDWREARRELEATRALLAG
jgi:hypothetical protein